MLRRRLARDLSIPLRPQITEPYLQIYRGILPPLFGQLDFTPLIGFLILQVSLFIRDVLALLTTRVLVGCRAIVRSCCNSCCRLKAPACR